MSYNIVLVEPEIPQNTGNIARTCAVTGTQLHIVKPMGFEITDAKLKRAGLDYWHFLGVKYYENTDEFFAANKGGRFFYSTTKAVNNYCDMEYRDGDFILFGKETKGLDEGFLLSHLDRCVRIPMRPTLRSLNLANSVAVAVYEVLRQNGFEELDGVSEYFGGDKQV